MRKFIRRLFEGIFILTIILANLFGMYLLGIWLLSLIHVPQIPLFISVGMGALAAYFTMYVLKTHADEIHPRTKWLLDLILWVFFGLVFLLIGMWALPELRAFLGM